MSGSAPDVVRGVAATWAVLCDCDFAAVTRSAGCALRPAVRVVTGAGFRDGASSALGCACRAAFAKTFEPLLFFCWLTEVEWFFLASAALRGAASEERAVPPTSKAAEHRITGRRVRFLGPLKTSLPFHFQDRMIGCLSVNLPVGPIARCPWKFKTPPPTFRRNVFSTG